MSSVCLFLNNYLHDSLGRMIINLSTQDFDLGLDAPFSQGLTGQEKELAGPLRIQSQLL